MAEARNPRFEQAVRDSFAAQPLMATIGAWLARVVAGEIELSDGAETSVATMLATIMTVRDRPDLVG